MPGSHKKKKAGRERSTYGNNCQSGFQYGHVDSFGYSMLDQQLIQSLYLFLTKLIFSDQGISVRYNQLNEYLGVLDMEQESYEISRLFAWIFFPIWIVISIIQTGCFFLANGKFHPLEANLKACV